ncbi:unnamed protein product [Paramecium sonneborni]|uniref:DH domain-containing protein n=1 Tax=Paramecium sonneborni TaxID=65129 RepID=A0A8S1N511_9CILI|nr:unnamed protein product [Paramecium sonneborni]
MIKKYFHILLQLKQRIQIRQRINQIDHIENVQQQPEHINQNQQNLLTNQIIGKQNDARNYQQEISTQVEDESDMMKSRQFSVFQKQNLQKQTQIVRYQSLIVDSDEDQDDKKNSNSDSEKEEEVVKVWTALKKSKEIPNENQIQQDNNEKENQQYFNPLVFEEVLQQSQINLNRNIFSTDKMANKSTFGAVLITQVDSEEDEQSKEELADQVSQEIGIISNQDAEVTAENRIMMSVMQTKFSQSIKNQMKLQSSLNNSSKSNQQDDIFKSKIVFINQTPVIVREDDAYIRKVRKIQNYFRFVQPYKKLKKQHRYRVNVINELIVTEKKYVSDLKIIKENIQKPLLQLIDSQDHVRFMFNVDSILYFNQEFLKILESQEKEVKIKPYATIMIEISVLLAGFKFYYDYCKEFEASKKMRDQYENTNQIYQKFFNDLQKNKKNQLNSLDIESYLIKPVQRLPKYVLLYKDLLKHTNKDHPDYENIFKCLKFFEEINDKNNQEMKIYLEQLKIVELQNLFGQHVKIAEPNRKYCFEEVCSIYTDKKENNIILYAFNNFLLFAQKKQNGQQTYCFHLQLTYQSYVKDKENTNYFENFFEVVNKTESIIIINQDNESKKQLIGNIQEIIQQLKQKQINMEYLRKTTSFMDIGDAQKEQKQQDFDYEIKVIVIGTEIRNTKSNPYTVYIIQIFIQEYQTKIFVRYSQIVSLQTIVNKFDQSLKVPVFSTLNWLHSNDSKVIDERKLLIEKFLSSVLNSSKCQNTVEYQKQILELLSLSQDFFSIPRKKNTASQIKMGEEEIKKMILQSQFSVGIKPNLLQSMMMNRQSSNIMQAAKAQAQRSSLLTLEQDSSVVIGQSASKQPYFIEVSLMDGRTIQVGFKKQTLTLFIKNEVAKFVGLKQWLDFRLFIVDQNRDQRVIDDDETMSSILDAHSNQNKGLINAFKKLFTYEQKFQFIFRKYFYLNWKSEEADYKQDEQRLKYIVHDLIWETRNEKFQFNFNDLCLITALFYYSTNTQQNQLSTLLPKVIPKNFLKSIKEEVWLKEIVNNINSLQQQLIQIQKDNQQSQMSKNKNLHTSIPVLAQLMFMNFFKTKQHFGMSQFFVECNKQTIQLFDKNFAIKINSNVFIGLNFSGFHILKPDNKMLIFTSPYGKLSEMKACTTEFCCTINNAKLTFKTQFPFEIKSLILEYQQLQEFTKQLAYGIN